jgi:hypothetical protein
VCAAPGVPVPPKHGSSLSMRTRVVEERMLNEAGARLQTFYDKRAAIRWSARLCALPRDPLVRLPGVRALGLRCLPGTWTRARTDLPPRKDTGRLTTSHSPVSSL